MRSPDHERDAFHSIDVYCIKITTTFYKLVKQMKASEDNQVEFAFFDLNRNFIDKRWQY